MTLPNRSVSVTLESILGFATRVDTSKKIRKALRMSADLDREPLSRAGLNIVAVVYVSLFIVSKCLTNQRDGWLLGIPKAFFERKR